VTGKLNGTLFTVIGKYAKIYICCYTFVVGTNRNISPLYKGYSLFKVYQKKHHYDIQDD
jgi:hypothetical protein